LVINDGGKGPAALASKWRKLYPAAVECLEDDFEHLITFLAFPAKHWERVRHSNFIERTFGQTRRRVKVIGRLPAERSCRWSGPCWTEPAADGVASVNPSLPSACSTTSAENYSHPHPSTTKQPPRLSHPPPKITDQEPATRNFSTKLGTPPSAGGASQRTISEYLPLGIYRR
jgi:Transposase, Mutator family